jgi:hypothetical protein
MYTCKGGASSRSTLNVSISVIRLDQEPSMSAVDGRSNVVERNKRRQGEREHGATGISNSHISI